MKYFVVLLLAVSAVAVADVLLKRAAIVHGTTSVMRSSLFWAAVGLYIFQIIVFTYLFEHKVALSYVGVLQTALYAGIVLGSSFLVFKERITLTQGVGMVLALAGVVLINLPK